MKLPERQRIYPANRYGEICVVEKDRFSEGYLCFSSSFSLTQIPAYGKITKSNKDRAALAAISLNPGEGSC